MKHVSMKTRTNLSMASLLLALLCALCVLFVAGEAGRTFKGEEENKSSNFREIKHKRMRPFFKRYRGRHVLDGRDGDGGEDDEDDDDEELAKVKLFESRRWDDGTDYYDDNEDEARRNFGSEMTSYRRDKRFYSADLGCIKGYLCCEISSCRPYCSLCGNALAGGGGGGGSAGKKELLLLGLPSPVPKEALRHSNSGRLLWISISATSEKVQGQ